MRLKCLECIICKKWIDISREPSINNLSICNFGLGFFLFFKKKLKKFLNFAFDPSRKN